MGAPALIVQDMAGFHNGDLEGARSRLIQGGSWRRQRIIMIVPSADMIAAKVYLSHSNLAFPPNNGVAKILALGQEVGEAYSNAIAGILADPNMSQWEYILTVESDNMPPPDGVLKLCEHMENHPEFAAISGAYWTKGPGGVLQAWGDVKDPVLNFRPQPPDPSGGLVECCGLGMGFVLYRLSMFKDERIAKPLFKTQTENGIATQDLVFWSKARPLGYRCAVACDVRVGHYDREGAFGPPDMVW